MAASFMGLKRKPRHAASWAGLGGLRGPSRCQAGCCVFMPRNVTAVINGGAVFTAKSMVGVDTWNKERQDWNELPIPERACRNEGKPPLGVSWTNVYATGHILRFTSTNIPSCRGKLVFGTSIHWFRGHLEVSIVIPCSLCAVEKVG